MFEFLSLIQNISDEKLIFWIVQENSKPDI